MKRLWRRKANIEKKGRKRKRKKASFHLTILETHVYQSNRIISTLKNERTATGIVSYVARVCT